MSKTRFKVMNVNLHIERLVLDGLEVSLHERPVLQAAVEAELGRLLSVGGLQPGLINGGAIPSVPGGVIQLTQPNNAARLGKQIAQAVYEGIGQ